VFLSASSEPARLGVVFGAKVSDFLANVTKNDPTGLSSLIPIGYHFRYYTITERRPRSGAAQD